MDFFSIISAIDSFLWGPPLIILLVGTGIYLTLRLKLLQVAKLPLAMKLILSAKNKGDGDISSFKALCLALSATVGTGNIVGVATAVEVGGPGAIFWMWVAAFFGWLQNMPKVFWLSNIARSTKTDMFSEDRFTILKTEWERTGDGWLKSLHFSEPVSAFSVSVLLRR